MTLQHKRSSVAGKVPLTTDLALGQLAINTNDGKVFMKKSVSGVESVVEIGGASGAVGNIKFGRTAPASGTWLQTGKYYSKAAYPELAAALGDVPDLGSQAPTTGVVFPPYYLQSNTSAYNNSLIAYGNNAYCMLGAFGGILYSSDGSDFRPVGGNLPSPAHNIFFLNGRFLACGNNGIVTSTDGINWVPAFNSYNPIYYITYALGNYWACGSNGYIYYSSDAFNWTQLYIGVATNLFSYVVHFSNNKLFLATSAGVYTSSNGLTWTLCANTGSYSFNCIASNGTYFVAGHSAGHCYSQDGGVTWNNTAGTLTNNVVWNAATSKFVAVGATIKYSADAKTFTDATSFGSWHTVAHDGTRFIAMGSTRARWATSTDGVSWTINAQVFAGQTTNGPVVQVVNGKTLVCSQWGAFSISGSTWTELARSQNSQISASGNIANVRQVAYGAGKYVYAPGNQAATQGVMLSSSDGATWTASLVGEYTFSMDRVVYLNGNFFAFGNGTSSNLWQSTDGVTWNTYTVGSSNITAAAYGAGMYVFVGASGACYSGSSFASLTSRSAGSAAFTDVIYANGQFLACNATGSLYTSPDGVTWTARGAGTSRFTRVIYANGVYVAVGDGGKIFYSTDGVSWPGALSPVATQLWDVVWNGTRFVAIGDSNTILVSTDGNNWTSLQNNSSFGLPPLSNMGYSLTHIYWTGSRFVVNVASQPFLLVSNDGIEWTRTGGVSNGGGGYSLSYANGKFVRAGSQLFEYSNDGYTWYPTNLYPITPVTGTRVSKVGSTYYYCSVAFGLWKSADGVTFSHCPGTTGTIASIAYSAGVWVCTSLNSGTRPAAIYRSTDGTNFSKVMDIGGGLYGGTPPNTGELLFANGNFVLLLAYSTQQRVFGGVYTSPDGLTWTVRQLPYQATFTTNPNYAATDGTTILAVTTANGVLKSSDGGVTWSVALSNANAGGFIAYSNSVWYFYSGNSGTFLSKDAVNWQQSAQSAVAPLYGIYSDGRYVISMGGLGLYLGDTEGAFGGTRLFKNLYNLSSVGSYCRDAQVRGSTLLVPQISQSGANGGGAILEFPLYSYDTSTTFWVPPSANGIGQNAYICAKVS